MSGLEAGDSGRVDGAFCPWRQLTQSVDPVDRKPARTVDDLDHAVVTMLVKYVVQILGA